MAKLPDDVAIRVDDIHKDFHLPHHNEDSIKNKIITVFEKKDKDVDTQHALQGISFDIKKGEFFGILGRNGSGKSTLLKIISEIYQPTKGLVRRHGTLVAFIELGVGFNPQLTGRENVYLNAALLGFSRKEIDAFYDEVVEFAELQDHMEQRLKNYSSGMKVRLAFAVAIQAHADILVLDEVLAVGDADFQRKCYDYFKQLKREQKTIILVSHSMGLVREYCDRAILIEEGRIAYEGSADETAEEYLRLFNRPKYEAEVKAKQQAERNKDRWGSGEVKFTAANAVITTEKLVITLDLKGMHGELDNVIVGMDVFGIISDKKILTTGVEDDKLLQHQFAIKKGETKRLTYTFDNLFGLEQYTATISLKSADGHYIYDFWRGAMEFTNPKTTSKYFPAVFPLDIEEK